MLAFNISEKFTIAYLKVGNGSPCAGHNRVKACPSFRSYPIIFKSFENVGALLPRGSKYKKNTNSERT